MPVGACDRVLGLHGAQLADECSVRRPADRRGRAGHDDPFMSENCGRLYFNALVQILCSNLVY